MKSNLKSRLLKALPYIIVLAVIYVLLPLSAACAKSAEFYMAVPMLDCCAAMGVGYFYGKKEARDPIMPVFSAVLFLPCMLVFFNNSAWIYMLIAALTCYLGQCFGAVARKR